MEKKSIHLITAILATSALFSGQVYASVACSGGEVGPGCTTTTTVTVLEPPRTYYYCDNDTALNRQTSEQCAIENNIRTQDACVRNNTTCRYQDTDFQTLCLQKTFSSMPDFTNMTAFNAANTLCTK